MHTSLIQENAFHTKLSQYAAYRPLYPQTGCDLQLTSNWPLTDITASTGSMSDMMTPSSGGDVPQTMASFQSQLEYLLTSNERKDVKYAIKNYKDTKYVR